MVYRRSFLAALAGAFAILAVARPLPAVAAEMETGASAFVESLSKQAVAALADQQVTRAERIARFRKLFNESFAVEAIGRWLLGPQWNKATEVEKKEYLALFEDLMVISYVDRFAEYAGTALKINRTVTENEKHVTVFSEINRPGGAQPVRVDWRVGNRDNGFKIVDVIVEGTSMSITMRSDFASVINQRGGKVAGLIEVLRDKTVALKQEEAARK